MPAGNKREGSYFMKLKKMVVLCLITFSVFFSSCLSMLGVKKLDLSTVDPHLQIGGFSMSVDRRTDFFESLCILYGDGKSISPSLFVNYLVNYADANVNDLAALSYKKAGLILDVERFKSELAESTGSNIEINNLPSGYRTAITWKSSQQDNPTATLSFNFEGNWKQVGVIKIENEVPYAAIIDL
jgi:hypothetical protein